MTRSARAFWWKVLRPFWLGVRWPVIAGLALAALFLGLIGFDSYLDARAQTRSFGDKLYLSLQLFGLESGAVEPPVPWTLRTARFLAPAVALYAAGSAVLAIFREQIARTRVRWTAHDHVVICGLGRTGLLLAKAFRARNKAVVVLERDPHNAALGESREEGIVVLAGDATDPGNLALARVDRARYLFAVCGGDDTNAAIAIEARRIGARRGKPLGCFVRILDPDLVDVLDTELVSRSRDAFRLEFFNPVERAAPLILDEHPPFDERGGTPLGPPHLLVVGLGQMGSKLVLHAVSRWKATAPQDGARFRVTVVDRDAHRAIESLTLRCPHLAQVCDLVALERDVDTPQFERAEFLGASDGRSVTGVYVCLGDDARGISAALRLRQSARARGVPIVVRTADQAGLGSLGSLMGDAEGSGVRVFGVLDRTCRPEALAIGRRELIAREIHADYVRHEERAGRTPKQNPSMVAWEQLPEHLRDSNRRQADDIGDKLRAIGCRIERLTRWDAYTFAFTHEEIERLARDEHESWWKEREADGWTFARVKDVTRKESPYLVPWEDLTEEIRDYDRNAVRGIPVFLARAGFQIVREGAGGHADGARA